MKKYIAEFLGTFALVFAGTGAIIINDVSNHAITHVGVALTFGLVVLAMIYTMGDVSGAHLNPAVTLGFWLARRLEGLSVLPYIVSQCLGGIAASGGLLQRVFALPDATVNVLQGILFVVLIASDTLYGRIRWRAAGAS